MVHATQLFHNMSHPTMGVIIHPIHLENPKYPCLSFLPRDPWYSGRGALRLSSQRIYTPHPHQNLFPSSTTYEKSIVSKSLLELVPPSTTKFVGNHKFHNTSHLKPQISCRLKPNYLSIGNPKFPKINTITICNRYATFCSALCPNFPCAHSIHLMDECLLSQLYHISSHCCCPNAVITLPCFTHLLQLLQIHMSKSSKCWTHATYSSALLQPPLQCLRTLTSLKSYTS